MSAEPEFNPYRKWLGIPDEQQPPTHYRLLGLADFEEDHDVIDHACERCAAHVKKLATGEHAELARRILKELKAARRCLLDPKTRKVYDSELRKRRPAAPPIETKPPGSAIPATPIPKAQPIVVQPPQVEATANPLENMGRVRVGSSNRVYKMRRKRSNSGLWLMLMGLAAFLLAAALIFALTRN